MKIAHIVSTFPPYYGGMGGVVFETASALSARGHEVMVFTPQYEAPKEETVEFAQRLRPSISYGNAARMPSIKRELDDFDIIHLHYPFFGTAEIVAAWKRKHPEKKLVVTYHMDTRSPGFKGIVFALYAKAYLNKILSSADACVSASFDYLAASDARGHFNAHKDKWFEIPFGVDVERFAPREKPLELFQHLTPDPTTPTLLFVGGMDDAHFFKGVPVLLKALLALKMQNTPVQAIFVGDGNRRHNYELLVTNYQLQHVVRFVGKVSPEDLPSYYNATDLLVLPSTTRGEAFGMVLIEAFASGVPVIASDLPGVRAVAGEAGIVVPPNDPRALAAAIAGFFTEGTDRAAFATHAREAAVSKYSWELVAQELEQVYLSLR